MNDERERDNGASAEHSPAAGSVYEAVADRLRRQGYDLAAAEAVADLHVKLIAEIMMWAGPLRHPRPRG